MIARIVRSADFERVLRTRSRVSSPHFAVHYVADHPGAPPRVVSDKLTTGTAQHEGGAVDQSRLVANAAVAPDAVWLGAVVPKRHARRAVTRTLLKRQIRAVVDRHAANLAGGLWVVRLRGPFDRARFVSAASDELRCVVYDELDSLIGSAVQRVPSAV